MSGIWREQAWKAVVAGSLFIGAATASAGALLYYVSLPGHRGPENSSPPPEAIGLIFGAALGCALGVAVVAAAQHSLRRAAVSFALAFVLGAAGWLVLGAESSSDRVGDCLLAALILGPAAVAGLALGAILIRLTGSAASGKPTR
jgi:hypothetical protein